MKKTRNLFVIRVLLWLFIVVSMETRESSAEWYAAGYGGVSGSPSLKDVTMDALGERIANQRFPQATNPTNPDALGQLVQSFSTSDVSLKSSLIFGGKAGYFFSNEGVSWLGIELEAFTSNPTIKQQTLTTKQDITYTPNKDAGANLCSQPPGIKPPNCPASVLTNSTLSLNESDLRVTTVAFNIIARYPDDTFQPYIGIGAGAFYFSSKTGSIQGTQVVPGLNALAGVKVLITEEWGIFAEGKYNRATLSGFDPTFGLSGEYSVFHAVGGIAYHF